MDIGTTEILVFRIDGEPTKLATFTVARSEVAFRGREAVNPHVQRDLRAAQSGSRLHDAARPDHDPQAALDRQRPGVKSIAYLTDVEGRWDKIASFCDGNRTVWIDAASPPPRDGVTFVFGGDANSIADRGAADRGAAPRGADRPTADRVVLLAGNRDINKLRLARELTGEPPHDAPAVRTRASCCAVSSRRRWARRSVSSIARTELGTSATKRSCRATSTISRPAGCCARNLAQCRPGFAAARPLFVHGGVTAENFGEVPGATRVATAMRGSRA